MKTDLSDQIDFLYEHEDLLSDWEITFLDSIDRQLKRTSSLSEKQQEKLKEIVSKLEDDEGDTGYEEFYYD
jgi:mRNA-degrading endonuclease RelE of RelBE toxin-antitoxin system